MFKTATILAAALVMAASSVSCGADETRPRATAESRVAPALAGSPATQPAGSVSATPGRSAADVGRDVVELYDSMLEDVTALLEDDPSPERLQQPLADLKARYIAGFVALGWERWDLDAEGRATADSAAAAIFQIDPAMIEPLTAAVARFHAMGTDEGIAIGNELASFNILSQYAFFEVLRRQLPAEADRLGVP